MPGRSSPLVGRDQELHDIVAVLRRMGRGTGGVVLVEGEAGIGKTSLCDRVLELASEAGAQVLRGAAEELESDHPFSVIARAVVPRRATGADTGRRDVREALLELGVAGHEEESMRYRAVEAVLDFVQRIVSTKPLVIAVDDLHWADASTLLVLSDLRRLVHDLPLVLLLTARPTPRSEALRALVRRLVEDGALRLALTPLAAPHVEGLACALAGARPGPTLLRQLDRAGGNPLYVVELIAAMRTAGAIVLRDGTAEADDTDLPDTLRQVVLRRLSSLGGATFELLRRAAVFGDTFSVAEVESLAGGAFVPGLEHLQEGLDAGVLAAAGERLAFRHDLVREALYLDIPAPIRKSLHRRVAAAMTASGRPPADVAPHLLAGAEVGDEVAVDTLRRAAEQLRWADPGVAADLFAAAGRLCRADDPRRPALLAAEVEGLSWSGRVPDVVRRAGEALERWPSGATAGRVRLALVRALIGSNRMPEAAAIVDARITDPLPAKERALLLAEGGMAKLGAGDLAGSRHLATLARECAPDEEATAAAVVTLAMNAWVRGETRESLVLVEEGMAALELARSAELERSALLLLVGAVLSWGDRVEEADVVLRRGLRRAEELGAALSVPVYHAGLGVLLYRCGRWHDAEAELETGLRFSLDHGHHALDPDAFGSLAQIETSRGDLEAAAGHVAAAEAILAASGGLQATAAHVMVAKAELLLASGRAEDAFHLARAVWERATSVDSPMGLVMVAPVLVLAGAETGRFDDAREVAAAMGDVASRMGTATSRGVLAFATGFAEDDPAQLVRAAAEFDAATRIPLAARAREEAAKRLLASAPPSEEAVSLLRAALAINQAMGARRDAARVSALLRTSGVRTGSRAAQRRTTTGWDALTTTERQVTELVGEGLTNVEVARRLFVSHRTVETHLTRIYRKLNLSSRAALAAALVRRTVTGPKSTVNTGLP